MEEGQGTSKQAEGSMPCRGWASHSLGVMKKDALIGLTVDISKCLESSPSLHL